MGADARGSSDQEEGYFGIYSPVTIVSETTKQVCVVCAHTNARAQAHVHTPITNARVHGHILAAMLGLTFIVRRGTLTAWCRPLNKRAQPLRSDHPRPMRVFTTSRNSRVARARVCPRHRMFLATMLQHDLKPQAIRGGREGGGAVWQEPGSERRKLKHWL